LIGASAFTFWFPQYRAHLCFEAVAIQGTPYRSLLRLIQKVLRRKLKKLFNGFMFTVRSYPNNS
jgi:hypothetical protein